MYLEMIWKVFLLFFCSMQIIVQIDERQLKRYCKDFDVIFEFERFLRIIFSFDLHLILYHIY